MYIYILHTGVHLWGFQCIARMAKGNPFPLILKTPGNAGFVLDGLIFVSLIGGLSPTGQAQNNGYGGDPAETFVQDAAL